MYHPTTRVLTTLELLQAHPRLSGPQIAERLEVDNRTVRRYITMLQDLGIPVEAERGRYGAYHLRPGFKLPPMMFTDDEALALTLGLLLSRRLGITTETPAAEGALAKIERVLPPAVRDQVGAVLAAVTTDLSLPASAPVSDTLVTLSAAVRERQRVHIAYTAWNERQTERDLDPYGVVFLSGRWFVPGFCHLRHDTRMFRLDRIAHAELRDAFFVYPEDFDPVGYVQNSLATMPGTWKVEVLLDLSLDEAREIVPPSMATLDPRPDGVILRCAVENLRWVARLLANLDCDFTIRQPPELCDEVRQVAARLIACAEGRVEQEQDSRGSRPRPGINSRAQ
jgi:predicted DNA-binding transcriptional regulator YafY